MQAMLMKYVFVLPLIMTILSSAQSVAGMMGPIMTTNTTTKDWRWVGTLTIGPDFINPGQTQTLALLLPFQNTYTKGSTSQTITDALGCTPSTSPSYAACLCTNLSIDAAGSPCTSPDICYTNWFYLSSAKCNSELNPNKS